MMKTTDLYDLRHSAAGAYLRQYQYPWQALAGIRNLIPELGDELGDDYAEAKPMVWIHKTAKIAPSAFLGAPCIIGAGTEVRHCAFIRGSALVGENCIVGNSVELKNVILFDWVQLPHLNYVGDSILGCGTHLGAGSVASNVKADRTPVTVQNGDERIETGLKKFGAMLGDRVEVGCNSVLNPGTVVGKYATVYPASCIRGVVPERSIWKHDGSIVKKESR